MPAEGWSVAVYGFAIDLDTRRKTEVTLRWRAGPHACLDLACGDRSCRQSRHADEVAALLACMFPAPDDAPRRPLPPDPVNINGTPRPRLRDRLARKAFENLAAAVVMAYAALVAAVWMFA